MEDVTSHGVYEDDYPIELERDIFTALSRGDVPAVQEKVNVFFDWMVRHDPEDLDSMRLKALELVLPVAKRHGMERIYLTCDQSNEASRRIIELSGARLLEIAKIPRDYFAWREGIEDHCIYQLDL